MADWVRGIKTNATIFIKKQGIARNFAWQEGYGIFTISHAQMDTVYHYINQAEHHRARTFREAYLALLTKNEIEFDEKYTFEWYDDTE